MTPTTERVPRAIRTGPGAIIDRREGIRNPAEGFFFHLLSYSASFIPLPLILRCRIGYCCQFSYDCTLGSFLCVPRNTTLMKEGA